MKLTTQRPDKPTARRRGAIARKAMPGQPAVANHVSADAGLERQADEAADRVVRGETNVARILTPAPAAAYAAPSSTAEPLPPAVRAEMERAFGADLEAVRIHRDSPAASAARDERAIAFTAGPHVFFDQGRFDPASAAGRALLAHELAHVLQQTGRRETVDLIHATDRTGSGGIQLEQWPYTSHRNPRRTEIQVFSADLAIKHIDASKQDKQLADLALYLGEIFNFNFPVDATSTSPALDELIEMGKTGTGSLRKGTAAVALNQVSRQFVLDLLKTAGPLGWETAIAMLDADAKFELQTARAPILFLDHYFKQKNWDYFAETFSLSPLKELFEKTMPQMFLQFFLSPWRPIQVLYGYDEAKKKVLEPFAPTSAKLGVSDRVLNGFTLLERLDKARNDLCAKWLEKAEKATPGYERAVIHANVTRYAVEWAEAEQKRSDASAIEKKGATLVGAQAQRVSDFWSKTSDKFTKMMKALEHTSARDLLGPNADLEFGVKGMPEKSPILEPIGKGVTEAATALFKKHDDKTVVPPSAEYEERLFAFKSAIGILRVPHGKLPLWTGAINVAQTDLTTLFIQGKETGDVALALGWILWVVAAIERQLDTYRAVDDDRTPDYADERLAHRLLIAKRLALLGRWAHWPALVDAAAVAMQAQLETESYIAIRADKLKEDENQPISRMQKDFAGMRHQPIFRDAAGEIMSPLTVEHLVLFYQGLYMETLADAIDDALKQQKQPGARRHLAYEAATNASKTSPRPKRYKLEPADYEIAEKPAAPGANREPLRSLLGRNKKYLAMLNAVITDQKTQGVVHPSSLVDVYVWVTPPLTTLVERLESQSDIQKLLKGLPAISEPFDWFARLYELNAKAKLNLPQLITDHFTPYTTARRSELVKKMRELTIHDRRELRDIVNNTATPSGYSELLPMTSKLLAEITAFRKMVLPFDDQLLQVGVLMLSIAEKLRALYEPSDNVKAFDYAWHELLKIGIAYSTPDKRNDIMPLASGETIDFNARRDDLQKVLDVFNEYLKGIQGYFGIWSDGETLGSANNEFTIEQGEDGEFTANGNTYTITRIYRPFEYTPKLTSSGKTTEPIFRSSRGGDVIPIAHVPLFDLVIRSAKAPEKHDPDKKLDEEEQYNIGVGSTLTVYADDDPYRMQLLEGIVSGQTGKIRAEELQALMQEGAELLLDVLELVPGVGQAVSVARAVTIGLQSLPAAAEVFQDLWDHPAETVEKIKNYFEKEIFDPGALIELLLFGNAPPALEAVFGLFPTRKTGGTDAPSTSKLGKALAALKRFGRKAHDSVVALRLRFRAPVRALQSEIVAHPKLAFAIQWAALNFGYVAEQLAVAKAEHPELPDLLKAGKEGEKDFTERLDEMLGTLAHLELPTDPIPVETVVRLIEDFIIRRIKAATGTKGKAILIVFEHSPLPGMIAGQVAEWIKGSKVDPNNAWKAVRPIVEKHFESLRDTVVEQIDKLLAEIGIPTSRKEKPNVAIGSAQPEAEPLLDEDAPIGDVTVPATGGAPLPASLRSGAEERLGHDFGHVRLHQGGDAAALTAGAGARALTSGSHVYLRSGLGFHGSEGRRVLDHELTHVVQQTGPRPLGRVHSDQPRLGASGAGLVYDADREAEAARAALGQPVELASGRAEGVQPDIIGSIQKALLKWSRVPRAAAFEGVEVGEHVPGIDDAKAVWKAVLAKLKSGAQWATFITPAAQKMIREHVTKLVPEESPHIHKVAGLAQRPKPGTKKTKGSVAPETYLYLPFYLSLLRGFLYAETGIGINIKASKKGTAIDVSSVDVYYVDLGIVPADHEIWKECAKNSGKLSDDDRHQLHQRMAFQGPLPLVWAPGFALKATFLANFQEVRNKEAGIASVPKAADFLLPKGTGLAVGTYGGLRNTVTGRQAHHTTQYLLVNFFRNNDPASSQPTAFPEQDDSKVTYDYPASLGLVGTMPTVNSVSGLGLQSLDTGVRGEAMPSLLISMETHQRGRVHLQRESLWDAGKDEIEKASQRKAVDKHFRSQLPAAMGKRSATDWNDFVATQPALAKTKIAEAMRSTYTWMYKDMRESLRAALATLEVAHYRGLVARMPGAHKGDGSPQPEYALDPGEMTAVIKRAEENNNTIMTGAGWPKVEDG